MIVFPNAKINLGLNVLSKRADGYHQLETVFYPIPLRDALEVVNASSTTTSLQLSGIPLDSAGTTNICIKAYEMLKEDFPQLPPVQMHLHKAIPSGAGLGGGSADASFLLKLLNAKYRLGIADKGLEEYALRLGSDCPFFIRNRPVFAGGRGEEFESVDVDLSSLYILVVNPGIHISTPWAFSQIKPAPAGTRVKEIIKRPIENWRELLGNDFETAVFSTYPQIGAIRESLYEAGALYASMSGSGSTVFGLFRQQPQGLDWPPSYFVYGQELPPINS